MRIDENDNKPKFTPNEQLENATKPMEAIDLIIDKAECLQFPGTEITICCMTLKNGFQVIGIGRIPESMNFDPKLGYNLSVADARAKVTELTAFQNSSPAQFIPGSRARSTEPGAAERLKRVVDGLADRKVPDQPDTAA